MMARPRVAALLAAVLSTALGTEAATARTDAANETDGGIPTVRVGALRFGTVNWELDVIREHALGAHHGVHIQTIPLASNSATHVALQGGSADVIVSDWVWVARQRAAGKDYTSVPYSSAVGKLMVRSDSGIERIESLAGRPLGIAGGPVDKSWLVLRAYLRARDRVAEPAVWLEPKFASPPLLNQLVLRNRLPAVLTFWHFAARLEGEGLRPLAQISDLLPALGVETPVPLLGWVFYETWAAEHPRAVRGFLQASYAAKKILTESNAEWARLAPLLKARTPVIAAALRAAYRAGIPRRFGTAERTAARRLFAILKREAGTLLTGQVETLEDGVFWPGFQIPGGTARR